LGAGVKRFQNEDFLDAVDLDYAVKLIFAIVAKGVVVGRELQPPNMH
jgi:hypothetical protein